MPACAHQEMQYIFRNIILLMQGHKHERQRRIDNVQKQLMTNYYLHKYNSLMSQITKQPEPSQNFSSTKPKEQESSRINFKNMILLKKNQNQNYPSFQKQNPSPERSRHRQDFQVTTVSREEQQNNKIVKKLEDSIINELYKTSPTKLEQGNYNKVQIAGPRFRDVHTHKFELEFIPVQNIEITEEEERVNDEQDEEERKEEEQRNAIKERIRQQFEKRYTNTSPKRSPSKKDSSASSKISMEIKINSPKRTERVLTPNRISSHRQSANVDVHSSTSEEKQRKANTILGKNEAIEQFSLQRKVHFQTEFVDPVIQEPHKSSDRQADKGKTTVQEDIEFIPPTSNYYKSDNSNLVEESFRFQQKQGSQKDSDSQRRKSLNTSERNFLTKQSYSKKSSKKSLKSGQKGHSEMKDSSNFQMSFVSKMSMLSAAEGHLIRDKIEKELYDNELGPYQSALYSLLDMINEFPRSGPVYAVGQRTLDDRQGYEERSRQQHKQMSQYKRGIQKLKGRAQAKHAEGEDETIRRNKLQIMRMIRKISTKL